MAARCLDCGGTTAEDERLNRERWLRDRRPLTIRHAPGCPNAHTPEGDDEEGGR